MYYYAQTGGKVEHKRIFAYFCICDLYLLQYQYIYYAKNGGKLEHKHLRIFRISYLRISIFAFILIRTKTHRPAGRWNTKSCEFQFLPQYQYVLNTINMYTQKSAYYLYFIFISSLTMRHLDQDPLWRVVKYVVSSEYWHLIR